MLYELTGDYNIVDYTGVLILILVEYALRDFVIDANGMPQTSLNPYSSGICSTSRGTQHVLQTSWLS